MRKQRWSLDAYPYLGFCDSSPFQGELFAPLAGQVILEHDRFGWHLSHETAKSWKTLEQALRRIATLLKDCAKPASPNFARLFFRDPPIPSSCGYFLAHSTEDIARAQVGSSLDAFAVFFAYVSFLAAVSQFSGQETETPTWLIHLENSDSKRTGIHHEFLNMFKKSHIVDFSGERSRTGTIIDVLECGWTRVVDILVKASIPIWFFWGDHPLMVNPRSSWIELYKPGLGDIELD
jgi:hypothetical protein